jgi:diguanylate cyclase (GGDEF)-like protein
MQVFISWSGEASQAVANELSKWLEHVVPNITTFVSTQDIDAGDRWEARISDELNASHHAVLCVTRDNQTAPWLLYEAGALGKLISRAKVIPYTIGFSPQELTIGPLSRFQGVPNDRNGTWELVRSLNRSQTSPKEEAFVRESFDLWWPLLETKMRESTTVKPVAANQDTPSDRDLLLQLREDINHVLRYVRQRELFDEVKQRDNIEPLIRDSLTQLANRRHFEARAAELDAAKSPYLIALTDLDNFKLVNDRYGHLEGDRVITVVAESLSEIVRSGDLVARYGGEEFAILFVDISVEAASEIMQRFIDSLPGVLKREGVQPITASVGLNSSKADFFRSKLQEADVALYEAKKQGRNRVVIHTS